MEKNLQEMAHVAADAGVALRPHVKTHKSPSLALRQLEYGAQGITVAKIGEADVMADAGIKDIRIAYPIVGTEKLARLAKLMDRADVSISIDSVDAARGLSELGQSRKKRIPVLLKINTGLDRVGVNPAGGPEHRKGHFAARPGWNWLAILTHECHALHEASLDGATRAAREARQGHGGIGRGVAQGRPQHQRGQRRFQTRRRGRFAYVCPESTRFDPARTSFKRPE
jgi:D-serine deaminase-like pyridoxal phosphate-dependent protein